MFETRCLLVGIKADLSSSFMIETFIPLNIYHFQTGRNRDIGQQISIKHLENKKKTNY